MTSIVKVTAHVSSDKEVIVTKATPQLSDPTLYSVESYLLQDGETGEYYIYDGITVTAKEQLKVKA